jgi:DNA-binding HxlR family transcriptional regulator
MLVRLAHFRWTLPVLAELHRSQGGRFANLAYALGVGRESLRRTLGFLDAEGLVQRNPGHGHPLRPEYLLTAAGAVVAEPAAALVELLASLGQTEVGLRKWSLPILRSLGPGPLRFSELRATLAGVTPRALTLALKDLEAAALVTRTVTTDYPPATLYSATPSGSALAAAAERLD